MMPLKTERSCGVLERVIAGHRSSCWLISVEGSERSLGLNIARRFRVDQDGFELHRSARTAPVQRQVLQIVLQRRFTQLLPVHGEHGAIGHDLIDH